MAWTLIGIPPPDDDRHLSLLCRLQQDRIHRPCSSRTCDGHGYGMWCEKPCECECHRNGGAWEWVPLP